MEEKFKINPFDRSALTDYRLLAGRATELRQIRFILRNSAKSKNRIRSILVSGERGVGKTSFLNLIEAESLINNLIPIRIDLTEANSSSSNDFFWNLFSQTINKAFNLEMLGGKGGPIDAMIQTILNTDGLTDPANWVFNTPILRKNYLINGNFNFEFSLLIDDLRLIRKQIIEFGDKRFTENTKILYLVDESQHIYSNSKIIEEIRFVIQSQDLGVGFVFAGDPSYQSSQWESVFGGTYREFEIINLSYFDDVDAVIDFFSKSLNSIDWTTKEIEETLFYRFKLACRHIFELTSGKPAWINAIASKMFERCMAGETKVLKFDKQAQSNIKKMLEESGDLDKLKLEFIEGLTPQYEKWLAEIFACELQTLRQVYFFTKFQLSGEEFLTLDQYRNYCHVLIENGIVTLLEKDEGESIGFKYQKEEKNILDKHYYSFSLSSDTIKQWLQIRSDGVYSFSLSTPAIRFMQFINKELITEKNNTVIISHTSKSEDDTFRLSEIIQRIEDKKFNVNDETYNTISILFKACKRLEDSRDKEVLYVELRNHLSGRIQTWNVYNYNDKEKVVGFRESPTTISKLKLRVKSYNNDTSNYSLELFIDKIPKLNLSNFQDLIIESNDTKKIGIILEDKMEDLIRKYVESNIDAAYQTAKFFYKLFEDGHDLSLKNLNNTGYVFTEKLELGKAKSILLEAKRKIKLKAISHDEFDIGVLVFYNLGIIEIKNENLKEGLKAFEETIEFCEEKDVDVNAGVLKILQLDGGNNIEIIEIKSGNKGYPKILCKKMAENNIDLIKTFFENKKIAETNNP